LLFTKCVFLIKTEQILHLFSEMWTGNKKGNGAAIHTVIQGKRMHAFQGPGDPCLSMSLYIHIWDIYMRNWKKTNFQNVSKIFIWSTRSEWVVHIAHLFCSKGQLFLRSAKHARTREA
jgi:hypothetical protein